jgi:hypothetical protein
MLVFVCVLGCLYAFVCVCVCVCVYGCWCVCVYMCARVLFTIFRTLLVNGTNTYILFLTVCMFFLRCSEGNFPAVKFFVEHGVPSSEISLPVAAQSGNLKLLKYLVKNNRPADPDPGAALTPQQRRVCGWGGGVAPGQLCGGVCSLLCSRDNPLSCVPLCVCLCVNV